MYREVLPIIINGLYTVRVSILGEGSPLSLELANPAHRSLNLGAISRGSQSSKSVQVTSAVVFQHVPQIGTLLRPRTIFKQRLRPCWPPVFTVCIGWKTDALYVQHYAQHKQGHLQTKHLFNMSKHDLVKYNGVWQQRTANDLQVCNRSRVTCLVSFAQAAQQLAQHAVELTPAGDVTIPARDALDMTFFYRCSQPLDMPFVNTLLSKKSGRQCRDE